MDASAENPQAETEQTAPDAHEEAPQAAPPAAVTAPEKPIPAAPVVVQQEAKDEAPSGHGYPSLYDSKSTTVIAVLLGLVIIGGIQVIVSRIFTTTKDSHRALTHFVVSMVALVVGAYLADLIISGPDTSLLAPSEKATILDFIKSTCLMVFAYFFGTRASASSPAD